MKTYCVSVIYQCTAAAHLGLYIALACMQLFVFCRVSIYVPPDVISLAWSTLSSKF